MKRRNHLKIPLNPLNPLNPSNAPDLPSPSHLPSPCLHPPNPRFKDSPLILESRIQLNLSYFFHDCYISIERRITITKLVNSHYAIFDV